MVELPTVVRRGGPSAVMIEESRGKPNSFFNVFVLDDVVERSPDKDLISSVYRRRECQFSSGSLGPFSDRRPSSEWVTKLNITL